MNLLILPDEMLTNVLKYTDFVSLRTLRKTNKRINNLAERYDLGRRVPVDTLTFSGSSKCYMSLVPHKFLGFNQWNQCHSYHDETEFNKILHSVTVRHTLAFDAVNLDEKLLRALEKERKGLRHLTRLQINNVVYCHLSTEIAKSFLLNTCRMLNAIHVVKSRNINEEHFCTPEVLGCRTWKYMRFDIIYPDMSIQDKFLLAVAPKCEMFRCHFYATFTLEGAIELMKRSNNFNHEYHLGCLTLGNVSPTEIEVIFKKEFQNVFIDKKDAEFKKETEYKIRITDKERKHIMEFQIKNHRR